MQRNAMRGMQMHVRTYVLKDRSKKHSELGGGSAATLTFTRSIHSYFCIIKKRFFGDRVERQSNGRKKPSANRWPGCAHASKRESTAFL
jgi:hypothetical protein